MLEIGAEVSVSWGDFRDRELGKIVALPTETSWAEVEFRDGIVWQIPSYRMVRTV